MVIKNILNNQKGIKWGVCSFPKEERLIKCAAIRRLPKSPKSVIVFSFPYYSNKLKGNISKYAMVPDYHIVVSKILEVICKKLRYGGGEFCHFVDNSPLPEVYLALRAGLGRLGKNGLLIDEEYGSFVFLGCIVTNLELEINEKEIKHCLNCGICEKVCPTQAIINGKIIREKCMSFITQKKSSPSGEEKRVMIEKNLLWGCDICQDMCPMNKQVKTTEINEFLSDIVCNLNYENMLNETRAYSYRGYKILKRNLDIINHLE